MKISISDLKYNEKVVYGLRSLYKKYGYTQYKMSKFEEYDLYVRNKDFLMSDSIITFTDTNGKLMALKPDITLSIIKKSKDIPGYVQKFYYNENVYRVSKGTNTFKEIMQMGLECIGDLDDYCLSEVLILAAKSLKSISKNAILDVSHLGILSAFFDAAEIDEETRTQLTEYISEKNLSAICKTCAQKGIGKEKTDLLKKLVTLYGSASEVMPKLREITQDFRDKTPFEQLEKIINAAGDEYKDMIRIDFSVVSDMKYYNGIIFKGFIKGIPTSVVSGGQYDRMMQRMGRKSGAIGFAVYLDMLERLKVSQFKYDEDIVLIYDKNTDIKTLKKAVEELSQDGRSVTAQRQLPAKLTYRQLAKIQDGEVKILETND